MKPKMFITIIIILFILPVIFGVIRDNAHAYACYNNQVKLTDDELKNLILEQGFDYFFSNTNLKNGLVRDRNADWSPSSIAGVGMWLTLIPEAINRELLTRAESALLTFRTLDFFNKSEQSTDRNATGYKGFSYHFLNFQSGKRYKKFGKELSSIDTALLMAGVLTVKNFYDFDTDIEQNIRSHANALYERVDWQWMMNNNKFMSHGWMPESGFLPHVWSEFNESMLLYIMAIGSPTHPIDPNTWNEVTKTFEWGNQQGFEFIQFPSLFVYQFPALWLNLQDLQDSYIKSFNITYFENALRATLAHIAYAIKNPLNFTGYGKNFWGLTASDDPTLIYTAHGIGDDGFDNGTITPAAGGGSFMFTPTQSLDVLRNIYENHCHAWGKFGPRVLNPDKKWVTDDSYAIEIGATLISIINSRDASIWKLFMQDPHIQRGLKLAGFNAVPKKKTASLFSATE